MSDFTDEHEANAAELEADAAAFVQPRLEEQTTRAPDAPLIHTLMITIGLLLPFVGMVVAMWFAWAYGWFDWTQFWILVIGYVLTGLGITIGYHRLLTHRAFETYPVVRGFWVILGALTVQKTPIEWCATHRKHHALTDQPGDPHSPHERPPGFFNALKGFWHAHSGWIFNGHIIKTNQARYVPDLLQDRFVMWVHRTWAFVWFPLAFAIPATIAWSITGTGHGALMGFLWGGCVRVFLVQHITFSTNSICHLFGTRAYQTRDESRNNLFCGIFSGGEGFHNNHHAFPSSARHGLEWWQPDLSWAVIRLMEITGLAWNVKLPSSKMIQSKRLSTQS